MEAILAIDGGATHTRCVAIDRSGKKLAEVEGGASNHLPEREDAVRARLAELTKQTLSLAKLAQDNVACLSAGLVGVDYDGHGAGPMLALFRELGFRRCLI